jgi:hypothetical protein
MDNACQEIPITPGKSCGFGIFQPQNVNPTGHPSFDAWTASFEPSSCVEPMQVARSASQGLQVLENGLHGYWSGLWGCESSGLQGNSAPRSRRYYINLMLSKRAKNTVKCVKTSQAVFLQTLYVKLNWMDRKSGRIALICCQINIARIREAGETTLGPLCSTCARASHKPVYNPCWHCMSTVAAPQGTCALTNMKPCLQLHIKTAHVYIMFVLVFIY